MYIHYVSSQEDEQSSEMDQRCAYVNGQILFMQWAPQKDGWIPDMDTMRRHRYGNLRVYQPSDKEEYLVTMPGHMRWPIKFGDTDIREVLEKPWVPMALQGMSEDEIDELDAYRLATPNPEPILRVGVRIDAPLIRIEIASLSQSQSQSQSRRFEEELAIATLASLSSYRQPTPPQTHPAPPPLPKHIQIIVLERAEAEGKLCPITMNPIRKSSASVTSCGHIFQTAAIQEWMSDNRTCPECRQICSVGN